jgi:formylglycine-generating enzyme required for sulfatase activity
VRVTALIAIAFLVLIGAVTKAAAEKRVALVVGNGAYRHADKLANPVNDAQGMRDVLKKLGFDVVYGEDLDLKGLQRAIGQFAGAVKGADVAMVYFAGHGATFGDTPYVVPIDAEFANLDQVRYELVEVERLIGELREATGVRIAILDACRDNAAERELKRQATAARGGEVTRGLGPMKNPSGLIIAYATQYMSTAADGAAAAGGLFNWSSSSAQHSPFTAALLNNIAAPGLDVKDMFYKVGRDVLAATGGKQRPEISISMYEQYALAPAASTPVALVRPDAQAGASATVAAPAKPAVPQQTAVAPPVAPVPSSLPVPEPPKSTAGQQTAAVAPPVRPAVPADSPCSGPAMVSSASRCAAPLSAAQERGLKPKDSFRECEKCPEMVTVPSGAFIMGGSADEEGVSFKEVPQHRVALGRAFAVGKFSVTFDEWDACVADGGCNGYRPDDRSWGRGLRPVINVSWDDAKNYVAWLSGKTGKAYRLLSEAEREYVTRAGTTTPFWWGSSISTQQANYNGRYPYGYGPHGEFRQRTLPVDSFGPNPWGLHQVHGNVFEWTEDCSHGNYNGAPSDGSAWRTGRCDKRIVRGGSWYDGASELRAAYRDDHSGNDRSNEVGFRVARALVIAAAPE